VLNPVVLAATLVAGVTFAVMIGCFISPSNTSSSRLVTRRLGLRVF
jgi:hypothetical protein